MEQETQTLEDLEVPRKTYTKDRVILITSGPQWSTFKGITNGTISMSLQGQGKDQLDLGLHLEADQLIIVDLAQINQQQAQ